MILLAPLTSGDEGSFVWDRVWSGDPYADSRIRRTRSQRRLTSFGLLNGSVPNGASVLDVGCGAGDSLADLAEAYGSSIKLTGADFSSRAVEAASARLGGRANIVRADATRLPFHDELFSHVLVFGLLEHIRDDDRALAEVWRVCARGAHVFISTSNASSALQGINYVRHNTLGYPYGYQRNVRRADVVSDVKRLFRIEKLDIQHADADMPVIRTVDRIVGKLLPNWGATST